jgi:hypothetical protein
MPSLRRRHPLITLLAATALIAALAALAAPAANAGTPPGAALRYSPDTLGFGTTAVNTRSGQQILTITNTGQANVRIRITITGPFRIVKRQCPTQLAPATACTLTLVFQPRESGEFIGRLRAATGAPRARLVGRTPGGRLSVDPRTVRFGSVSVGERSPLRIVLLRNVGDAPLTITRVRLRGTDPGNFRQDWTQANCGLLPPGGLCAVATRFVPLVAGDVRARLDVDSNQQRSRLFGNITGADLRGRGLGTWRTLVTSRGGLKLGVRGRVTVGLTCQAPGGSGCFGVARIFAQRGGRRVTIGSARFLLNQNADARLRIRLTNAARAAVRRNGSLRVQVRTTTRAVGPGRSLPSSAFLTIRR